MVYKTIENYILIDWLFLLKDLILYLNKVILFYNKVMPILYTSFFHGSIFQVLAFSIYVKLCFICFGPCQTDRQINLNFTLLVKWSSIKIKLTCLIANTKAIGITIVEHRVGGASDQSDADTEFSQVVQNSCHLCFLLFYLLTGMKCF